MTFEQLSKSARMSICSFERALISKHMTESGFMRNRGEKERCDISALQDVQSCSLPQKRFSSASSVASPGRHFTGTRVGSLCTGLDFNNCHSSRGG